MARRVMACSGCRLCYTAVIESKKANPMKTYERITVDPTVMVGKPIIKGTRITVEAILRKLGAGWDTAQILDAYPHLRVEDIYEAVQYAADVVAMEDIEIALPNS